MVHTGIEISRFRYGLDGMGDRYGEKDIRIVNLRRTDVGFPPRQDEHESRTYKGNQNQPNQTNPITNL